MRHLNRLASLLILLGSTHAAFSAEYTQEQFVASQSETVGNWVGTMTVPATDDAPAVTYNVRSQIAWVIPKRVIRWKWTETPRGENATEVVWVGQTAWRETDRQVVIHGYNSVGVHFADTLTRLEPGRSTWKRTATGPQGPVSSQAVLDTRTKDTLVFTVETQTDTGQTMTARASLHRAGTRPVEGVAAEALQPLQPFLGTWEHEGTAIGTFEGLPTKGRQRITVKRRFVQQQTGMLTQWELHSTTDGKRVAYGSALVVLDPATQSLKGFHWGYDGDVYWTGTSLVDVLPRELRFHTQELTINGTFTRYTLTDQLLEDGTMRSQHVDVRQTGKTLPDIAPKIFSRK